MTDERESFLKMYDYVWLALLFFALFLLKPIISFNVVKCETE